ncbi:hypothetical protein LTR62_006899 [Meristemomyces frigidus]|uniref:deoxyribose-phosphate aldolase n=1 Tax=Meristemomyces frigidus TaxID=1508187 RepID=A0AAN7TDH0_9PEZI|nr:hypothetical protein LTR62_006899 [Meristemomyces frigidus]
MAASPTRSWSISRDSVPAVADHPRASFAPNMTTRYTNDEWARFIAELEREIEVNDVICVCPDLGSEEFAKTIDHTLLKLEAKSIQFDALCSEARVDRFATVCVRPQWVKQCVSDLKGSDVKVASVIGFHKGSYDLLHKAQETKEALAAGAEELDIVINYTELKNAEYDSVYNELATLRLQAPHPILLKLILETSQLSRSRIIAGCVMAAAAQFDFVKTSTGFNGAGAKEEHVRLMAACCQRLSHGQPGGRKMLVKASGGIRTIEDAVKMLEAGASRLGTSNGVWLAKEGREFVERSRSPLSLVDQRRGSRPNATRLFTDDY